MALKGVIGTFKTVHQFLSEVIAAVKNTPWPDAVNGALPWAEALGEGIASTVAPVKFVLEVYAARTRIDDPNELGELACTAAFQRSVQQAIATARLVPDGAMAKKIAAIGGEAIAEHSATKDYDFTKMRLDAAMSHEFCIDAKGWLTNFLKLCEAPEAQRNQIVTDVDQRFAANLELILSNREVLEKFDPFCRLLMISDRSGRAYANLRKHAAYQRWLYEERRILREEPYALQHTYVRTDCGDIAWGDIERRHKERLAETTKQDEMNVFRDHPDHGGRHDTLETLLRHLSDPVFRDVIVIQGPAGTGKSSLTLRLCHELISRGLSPIRVELKHLDTAAQRHVRDTLPEAVRIGDSEFDPSLREFHCDVDLFMNDAIFAETAELNGTTVCRYVLILDAWDEISVGAEEGYQQHVERLIKEIRDTYLDSTKRNHPVRVILTGRPTEAVTHGRLLRDPARLLTLRYFTLNQLKEFHDRLTSAVVERPVKSLDWVPWSTPNTDVLNQVRGKYEKSILVESPKSPGTEGQSRIDSDAGMELLGSPLLGLLSLRLLSQWAGTPESLLESRTVLYRSLIDLLLGGGKPQSEIVDGKTAHLHGDELRSFLWSTAEAMSVLGVEAIPKGELLKRVRSTSDGLNQQVSRLLDEKKLSRLLVSFFFHGGRSELGCEFSHKSFREYLFAECVVEELKRFGRTAQPLAERDLSKFYWRDFPKDDARREFVHRLARLLGPQWLSREVGAHIASLIEWEVQRAAGADPSPPVRNGQPTLPLPLGKWRILRDWLADAWDWWGEGVHLRPQPVETDEMSLVWEDPIALSVVKTDRMQSGPTAAIRPTRITTIDSHLGDAIFQLSCDVHRAVIEFGGSSVHGETPRRYQSLDNNGHIRFRPGRMDYWRPYYHRIEAAGYRFRFRGPFPQSISLAYIDWRYEDLRNLELADTNLYSAILKGANVARVDFRRANLVNADCFGANLMGANLAKADLAGADLNMANLNVANLMGANISGTTYMEK